MMCASHKLFFRDRKVPLNQNLLAHSPWSPFPIPFFLHPQTQLFIHFILNNLLNQHARPSTYPQQIKHNKSGMQGVELKAKHPSKHGTFERTWN